MTMADNTSRPYGPASAGPAGRATTVRPTPAPESPDGGRPRNAYQQRVDQLKVRITELSQRNMENAMRIIRAWLLDKGGGKI